MGAGSDWLGLTGRICVVTGAASGIGEAVAASLVAAGATVALLDRDKARCDSVAGTLREAGGRVLAAACDTSDGASVAAAAEAVRRELGAAQVLVNNAGMLRPGPLATLPRAEWDALLAVNLTGYLLCAQEFGRDMMAAGQGSIVQVASIAGSHPQTRSGAYSASKTAVVMLSRQLAAEWGPSGIRCNTVSPGLIRTPLSEAFYQDQVAAQKREAMVPSRRIGGPQDIADPILFLASDRARYVNGAELLVDGGLDSMLMDLVPRPGY